MANIVGPTAVARSKNLYFKRSMHLRGATVKPESLGGNFVIDTHGLIYKISEPPQDTAAITIVGGLDTFVNEKQYRAPVLYLTQKQKNTLYAILKQLALNTDSGQVSCQDNDVLDRLLRSAYFNYCG